MPAKWSLCSWVYTTPSNFVTPSRSIWILKSGPVSTTTRVDSLSIITEVRRRWSRGSSERHTSQEHPMMGTPWDVPVPKNTRRFNLSTSPMAMARRYPYL